MAITAAEQYLIELINRARLDPQAEADRYLAGNLNKDNFGTTITAEARQPLSGNDALHAAAAAHSVHMLNVDMFAHEGIGDGTPSSRMVAAGYTFSGSSASGENISARGSTGQINLNAQIESHHSGLFDSIGHRRNILDDDFREIGVGQEAGIYSNFSTPGDFNTSMLTEKFAKTGNATFITGVVYNDTDNDDFYSIGEGQSGNTVSVSNAGSTVSAAAGGYSIDFGGVAATRTVTSGSISVSVTTGSKNVKLDFVDGNHVYSSASLTLNTGVASALLLGTDNLDITGSNSSETLLGNSGKNKVYDKGGNDFVELGAGNDYVRVGGGIDSYHGGAGSDYISYVGSSGGVRLDLEANTASGGEAQGDTISGFERAAGSLTGDDDIRGTSGNNTIRTYGGDDVVYDRGGNDTVQTGSGRDFMRTEGGVDEFDGGDGRDFLTYRDTGPAVRINLTTDSQAGGAAGNEAADDTIVNIESIGGTNGGNDVLIGDDVNNSLYGYNGHDRLYGAGGNDRLLGGNGMDFFDGGTGNDRLYGGNSNDRFQLDRGEGNDTVYDFQNNVDTLEFDNFGYVANVNDLMTNYASQQGSDVLFDFGADGSMLVLNTTIAEVTNDVALV